MGEGSTIQNVPAVPAAAAAPRHDEVVPIVLMLSFMAIIVCVGIFRAIARRELRRRPAVPAPRPSAAIFDPPARWLAVRSQNPRAVESALAVRNPRSCSWGDALARPFEPRLFIAPPVQGWILVLGCDLPDPADDVDECFKFLTGLSRELGEVQFFSHHRAVGHHGWALLDDGRVLRAYVWAGATLWNQGLVTAAERELKIRCLDYGETTAVPAFGESEKLALNTDKVVRLAAAWSIDPTSLDRAALEAKGIAGDLLHGKLH